MVDVVPVLSLDDANKEYTERFTNLKTLFLEKYEKSPSFLARASGRVNLIGEHIDYCGYGVLPMAIEQDVLVAVVPNSSGVIQLSNIDGNYRDFECSATDFPIDKNDPQWYFYFLCGVKGILEHSKKSLPGMQCLVSGTVPPSAGLSSSSALVCAAALATSYVLQLALSKKELADLCAHCERYIGTEGGGMDQAISFMAQKGMAKLIEFNPLRSTDVCLPNGASFVVTNSCVQMNKAASSYFNIRVVECRLAAQILAKTKGLSWRDFQKLGDVQKALGITLEDAVSLVQATFHEDPYTKEEICSILGTTAEELAQTTLSANTLDVQSFKLYQRALHVFSEANRVWRFKAVCDNKPANALEQLGSLMSESHNSCSKDYECSCTQLDHLVDVCLKSGALGSRLTGAGWGGCAVSLVPTLSLSSFMEKVKVGYYDIDPQKSSKLPSAMFASQPGGGAAIYTC